MSLQASRAVGRQRHVALALITLVLTLSTADRATLGVAAPGIAKDLNLSPVGPGHVHPGGRIHGSVACLSRIAGVALLRRDIRLAAAQGADAGAENSHHPGLLISKVMLACIFLHSHFLIVLAMSAALFGNSISSGVVWAHSLVGLVSYWLLVGPLKRLELPDAAVS